MNDWRVKLVICCLAGTVAVVAAGAVTGCGSASVKSRNAEAVDTSPVLHRPVKVWTASNPGDVAQGGPHVAYQDLAASGNVMVGVASSDSEGSLLVRLNPANGRPLWIVQLPSYAERNALAIREGRILLVAPGGKLTPDGIEGEGPAVAYAFSLKGAKLWEDSLGASINGTAQSAWAPPTLPSSSENYPDFLTDFDQIPGEIILYEGTDLRGIDESDGKEWTYTAEPTPERIVGPDPGGPGDLHLVTGEDEVLINGHSGREEGRDRATPEGRDIGLVGPIFQRNAAEAESPVSVPGIGEVRPLLAFAGPVVYAATDRGLIAIDSRTGKRLWTFPDSSPFWVGPAAAGNGFVLATGEEGTFLLREGSAARKD